MKRWVIVLLVLSVMAVFDAPKALADDRTPSSDSSSTIGDSTSQGDNVRSSFSSLLNAFNSGKPNGAPGTDTNFSFSNLVGQVITIILFVAGVAAVLYLLISGLRYITAGGDDEKAGTARKGIINAVIGIFIVMAVWFIFNATINVGKGITDKNPAKLQNQL